MAPSFKHDSEEELLRRKPELKDYCRVVLSRTQNRKLKKLSGWQSSFRVPEKLNSSANIFLAEISSLDLKNEIDSVYQMLRENLKLKRKEISSSISSDASAAIITPEFAYSISIKFNANDLSEVFWTRCVDQIASLEGIGSSAFCDTFDNYFDTISLTLPIHANISDFVDQAEDANIPFLSLKYDEECSYCNLIISGRETSKIRLTSETLSIVNDSASRISELIDSYETIQSLVHSHNLSLPLR